MTTFTHEKRGWSLELPNVEELKQRDADKFRAAYNKLPAETMEYSHRVVEAALKAGWIKAAAPPLAVGKVGEEPPAYVSWLSRRIDALYAEAMAIPPE